MPHVVWAPLQNRCRMSDELTRGEIRDRLTAFAGRWSARAGDERKEAQQFLIELLECYGVDWHSSPHVFEHTFDDGSRADLFWPGRLLVEMKSASHSEQLETHLPQAKGYWEQAGDVAHDVPRPQFMVLCSFLRMIVYELGAFGESPRAQISLDELPERLEVLDFLRDRPAQFDLNTVDLARSAVDAVTDLYLSLIDRGMEREIVRDFTLQCTWCCFAEDLGVFDEPVFTEATKLLARDESLSTYDVLGELFEWLAREDQRPTGGMFRGVPFVNGGLFERPARLELEATERELLLTAALADWSDVEPAVFGGLFTGTIATERRRAQGAHYTPAAEIQKLVQPTVVRPWREPIEAVATRADALTLLDELAEFRVLDPACGCGNFLYVAYRELRHLEADLRTRIDELHRADGVQVPDDLPRVGLDSMLGIEKDAFAAHLARVVLWIGHKVAIDDLGIDGEDYLPLEDLPGIQVADALKIEWQRCDAIVSNPPFVGDRMLRKVVGDEEIEYLKQTFGIGVKDYCVYWFRKAHDHLKAGQRAGLVGTNSVSQNRGRAESLEYIAANGGVITDAVSTQDWPGEATVEVSLVNWVKNPTELPATYSLDGALLGEPISPSLRPLSQSVDRATDLDRNARHAFIGPVINGKGFLLDEDEALELSRKGSQWAAVIRPYLVGEDILSRPDHGPSRWVIDFGFRSLEECESDFPEAIEIARKRVKPHRDHVRRAVYREKWWRFAEPIKEMREQLEGRARYIAAPAQGKRIICAWQEPRTCPSNMTIVFAFDDDYSMGLLLSCAHTAWIHARSSTLRHDLRYTPTTVFMSFPWPDRTPESEEAVGAAAAALISHRDGLCLEKEIGLTTLYNQLDEGAHRELRDLHLELDRAVADAYGWPRKAAQDEDELVRLLLERNLAIGRGEVLYAPFPAADAGAIGAQGQLGG
jgi:type I restriction-modification system DNA methylase subunit